MKLLVTRLTHLDFLCLYKGPNVTRTYLGAVMKTSTDGGLWTWLAYGRSVSCYCLLTIIDYSTAGRLLWTHLRISHCWQHVTVFKLQAHQLCCHTNLHCESPAGCAVHQYLYLLAAKMNLRCFRCKLHSRSEPWLSNLWTSTLPVNFEIFSILCC